MAHNDTRWTDVLPVVLLGLRSAWKDDLKCSAAEMVYGEPLRIPGEFFQTTNSNTLQPAEFVSQLREYISKVKPVPASSHCTKSIFVHRDLKTCTHIYLRKDALRGALQPPYTGPHRVLSRTDKTVTVELSRGPVTVSIDRVKPSYSQNDTFPTYPFSPQTDDPISVHLPTPSRPASVPASLLTTPPRPVKTTRSGRQVKFPVCFSPER